MRYLTEFLNIIVVNLAKDFAFDSSSLNSIDHYQKKFFYSFFFYKFVSEIFSLSTYCRFIYLNAVFTVFTQSLSVPGVQSHDS